MSWNSIPHAHAFWNDGWGRTDPPDALQQAEAFILRARPETMEDVICILDVLCASAGDARSDDLDQAALGRVRWFLKTKCAPPCAQSAG